MCLSRRRRCVRVPLRLRVDSTFSPQRSNFSQGSFVQKEVKRPSGSGIIRVENGVTGSTEIRYALRFVQSGEASQADGGPS